MGQMYFTAGGTSKRLKMQSDVATIELHDETVIRWRRAAFEPPRRDEKVRIAAFDLDETLTTTKSGTPFAKHGHDWRLLEHMTRHLEALTRDEARRTIVVVFTNQGGVIPQPHSRTYVNIETKIGGVLKALPMVSLVYAAAKAATPRKRAQYRKPGRGMFELLQEDLKPGTIDMATSFYVGDAAGRPGDHSRDDKDFAKGVGLRFYTPEQWLESEHVDKSRRSSSPDSMDSSEKLKSAHDSKDATAQQPATEQPVVAQPVVDQPVVDQPVAEQPAVERPANEQQPALEPAAHKSTDRPTTSE